MITMSPLQPSVVLRMAKAIIQRDGWHQCGYRKWGGSAVCAAGALNKALTGDAETLMANVIMIGCPASILREVVGMHIPMWNDDPETTLPDVLAAFDVAITIATEREAAVTQREEVTA